MQKATLQNWSAEVFVIYKKLKILRIAEVDKAGMARLITEYPIDNDVAKETVYVKLWLALLILKDLF